MKITKITWRMGNDFTADTVCEHCGEKDEVDTGYDDTYYHNQVIPAMKCKACGKARKAQHETP